jgi:hypothetical protein
MLLPVHLVMQDDRNLDRERHRPMTNRRLNRAVTDSARASVPGDEARIRIPFSGARTGILHSTDPLGAH